MFFCILSVSIVLCYKIVFTKFGPSGANVASGTFIKV